MVRILKVSTFFDKENNKELQLVEAMGISTDEKPTAGVATGSIFLEADSGTVSFFDEESGNWVEQFTFKT